MPETHQAMNTPQFDEINTRIYISAQNIACGGLVMQNYKNRVIMSSQGVAFNQF